MSLIRSDGRTCETGLDLARSEREKQEADGTASGDGYICSGTRELRHLFLLFCLIRSVNSRSFDELSSTMSSHDFTGTITVDDWQEYQNLKAVMLVAHGRSEFDS